MTTTTQSPAWTGLETALDSEDFSRMPGHWVLARLGKQVLRPGGIELTRWMLATLGITESDHVVELAPGIGRTARLALQRAPANYTAIDKEGAALARLSRELKGPGRSFVLGSAEQTGLETACSTIVYGEAFLTMQSANMKEKIVEEIARILKPGGRYGLHEMSLAPDDLDSGEKAGIQRDLSQVIRVNARPLTLPEWTALLERHGLRAESVETRPMSLLEVRRFIEDEGGWNSLRFLARLLRRPAALKRVLAMFRVFRKYRSRLGAVGIIAVKT